MHPFRLRAMAMASFLLWALAIQGRRKLSASAPPTAATLDAETATATGQWSVLSPGAPRVARWTSGDGSVALEEHIVPYGFLTQSYAYWRYGLNGKRFAADAGADATTHFYASSADLRRAVEAKALSAGAVVFLDVRYATLDTDWDSGALFDRGLPSAALDARGPRVAGLDEALLDPTCVYDHTPDLVLRSRLLRALLAYEKPLKLVVAGDVGCRLRLPPTHHAVVLAGDGGSSCEDCGWWPQGIEGLKSYDFIDGGAEAAAADVLNADWAPPSARTALLHDGYSVNARKPSREALVEALRGGGAADLGDLADRAGLALSLDAALADGGKLRLRRGDAGSDSHQSAIATSVFALCPAGDVWSSGRILEALTLGAIPVVDATYGSSDVKGCADPAAFWRDGGDGFDVGAPFVFVRDWANLAEALEAFGAAEPSVLERRFEALAAYRAALERHLRARLLDAAPVKAPTACAETPLGDADAAAQLDAAYGYYASGRTPTSWFADNADSPDVPGATCTSAYATEMADTDIGMLCFDAACAPPNARSPARYLPLSHSSSWVRGSRRCGTRRRESRGRFSRRWLD